MVLLQPVASISKGGISLENTNVVGAPVFLKHGLESSSQGLILVTDIQSGKTLFEGYVRQCVHCQNTWTYRPGSGIARGFCRRCSGHTCGQPKCETCYHKEKRIEDMEAIYLMNKRAIEAAVRQQILREAIFGSLRDRVPAKLRAQNRVESRTGEEGRAYAPDRK